MSCLVLLKGYKSKQTSYAFAGTEAPITMKKFVIQQSRWIWSFFREIPWQVRAIGYQSPALAFITQSEVIYPFLVMIWMVVSLFMGKHLLRGGSIALLVIMLRALSLFIHMGCNVDMLWNLAYLPMYFTTVVRKASGFRGCKDPRSI